MAQMILGRTLRNRRILPRPAMSVSAAARPCRSKHDLVVAAITNRKNATPAAIAAAIAAGAGTDGGK
jgi:hypothetical protein